MSQASNTPSEPEWALAVRDRDGVLRIRRSYTSQQEAEEWFDYLCGPWREELEAKAAAEDLDKTNWAHMTLKEKKQERHFLLVRDVTPYSVLREAPEWE